MDTLTHPEVLAFDGALRAWRGRLDAQGAFRYPGAYSACALVHTNESMTIAFAHRDDDAVDALQKRYNEIAVDMERIVKATS